ncbi:Histidine kinase [Chishuiella changwenlii]|uniref:Histidine kinase n=1 Tax=Chishuiella changwenlii TaxID=1434701 RepID=A0A1M6ZWR6_9FLAO|nr:histidine kinase [Chishuiella changwenlii]GGE92342.1 histidine kinase [Chishuiella changwenlii]SHL34829.1 Histidine kinase [Chishuiella changwenlii]
MEIENLESKKSINSYLATIFELGIFVLFFILYTFSEWNVFNSYQTFSATATYFVVLYVQARLQRFQVLKFLKTKKIIWILGILLVLFINACLVLLVKKTLFHYCNMVTDLSYQQTYIFSLASSLVSALLINIPFFFQQLFRSKKKEMDQQLLMKDIELYSLRSKLNPHFIFNAFNNLYGTSLHEPEKVPEMLMNISELMRYQLDHLSNEKVFLNDEIRFIETYLSLEEERLNERCVVDYNYERTDKSKKYKIAPLILMPFVENAFKHGTNTIEKSFVNVWITENENGVNLVVENSIPNTKNQTKSTKLGLKNIQQRLDILYPEKYKLVSDVNEKIFKIELSINLSDG